MIYSVTLHWNGSTKRQTEEHKDQTKCFWMAGDLSQLMHNERKYSYEKLFISYKDKIPGIHDTVVWLDVVMRCGKSVFETWEKDREDNFVFVRSGYVS